MSGQTLETSLTTLTPARVISPATVTPAKDLYDSDSEIESVGQARIPTKSPKKTAKTTKAQERELKRATKLAAKLQKEKDKEAYKSMSSADKKKKRKRDAEHK
jgi:hypothetical protein